MNASQPPAGAPTRTPPMPPAEATPAPPKTMPNLTPESAIERAERARIEVVGGVRSDIVVLDAQIAPLQAARDRLQAMLPGGAVAAPAPPRRRQSRRPRAVEPGKQ